MATREEIINGGKSWSGHEHNHTFINQGDGSFVDVSRLSGADAEGDGRSVALVDWDDDGSLDLLLRSRSAPRVQVFHNRYHNPGNFIAVELRGNGTTCNRDAIGSRVTIEVDGKPILRALRAGEGFLAQSSKRLHFGIGAAQRVDKLQVQWADGSSSSFEGLEAGKRYRIEQGAGAEGLSELAARPQPLGQVPSEATENLGSARRAVLAYPLPLAELPVPSFENPKRKVRDLLGSPILLNLWQVECTGCMVEFNEFKDEKEALAATGLRIVTLNADAGEAQSVDSVHSKLKLFGLHNADSGYVGKLMPAMMQVLERHIYGEAAVSGEVIMPTSWLLDERGQLLAIYRGALDMPRLFSDLKSLTNGEDYLALNRLSHGIRLVNKKRKLLELSDAFKLQAERALEPSKQAFQDMADFFLAEDKLQRGFILRDGVPKPMIDPNYDGPRKSIEQQKKEQVASGLDDPK